MVLHPGCARHDGGVPRPVPLCPRARRDGGAGAPDPASLSAPPTVVGSEQALAPALASQRTFGEGACFKLEARTPTSSQYELFSFHTTRLAFAG